MQAHDRASGNAPSVDTDARQSQIHNKGQGMPRQARRPQIQDEQQRPPRHFTKRFCKSCSFSIMAQSTSFALLLLVTQSIRAIVCSLSGFQSWALSGMWWCPSLLCTLACRGQSSSPIFICVWVGCVKNYHLRWYFYITIVHNFWLSRLRCIFEKTVQIPKLCRFK